jgi:hypothetical protein
MRVAVVLALLVVPFLGGCRTSTEGWQATPCGCPEDPYARPLSRGDWYASKGNEVYAVTAPSDTGPPRRIGYLVGRDYRRGEEGTPVRLWQVTTLDRAEVIGTIDGMGRATRFEPRRGGGVEKVDAGTGTLEESVGAVFATQARLVLEPTSERRLAFEVLDTNGDGRLQAAETDPRVHGDRIARADANRDGEVDFQEFDALDTL